MALIDFMKILAAFATAIFAFSTLASAQNDPRNPDNQEDNSQGTDKEGHKRFWEANVNGGNYLVALSSISAVSRHNYVLDGTLIVNEVTVDTNGQGLVRFYFIQPMTDSAADTAISGIADRTRGLIEETIESKGGDVHNMVHKKYPDTTHSKTIEYRMLSEAQLNVLYGSVKTAWVTGRGRVFTGL